MASFAVSRHRWRRAIVLSLAPLAIGSLVAAQDAEPAAAIVIEADSVAERQVVALGRDVKVLGDALGGVAAIQGGLEVAGRVRGTALSLGGDIVLRSSARVEGDVFALGGTLATEPGAQVSGRAVAYPTAPSAWLALAEGPALGLSPLSPVVLAAKCAVLVAWILTAIFLASTAANALHRTARSVGAEPMANLFYGLFAVLTALLTAAFLSLFLGPLLGVPLIVLLAMAALLAKLWGVVCVCLACGQLLQRRLPLLGAGPVALTLCGLLLLGALKLVPWVGTWLWTGITLVGMGAALRTKFGLEDPWFGRPAAP